ncbi:unnamed protein product, partial [marine sediment metagenome]
MRNKGLLILVMLVSLPAAAESAVPGPRARAFIGQDLHLAGRELISYQLSTGEHTLVLQDRFSMSIGANQFSSDNAVVWL